MLAKKDTLGWHIRQNLQIAIPVTLSQLGHMIVQVADTIMIGRLGEVPLAASSLAHSVFILPFMFAIGYTYGITPLVAANESNGRQKNSARLLKNSLYSYAVIGLLIIALLLWFIPNLDLLQSPESVTEKARPYLFWVAISTLPFMFFQSFKQFAEGLADTKIPMAIIVGANLLNILGNYLLIFGKWGFPEMGLLGAGISTFASRVIMAVVMIIYFYAARRFAFYREHLAGEKLYWISQIRLRKMGLPIAFQYVFEVGAFSFAVVMIGWLGARQLAAHQIAINLAAVTYMSASGISSAATVRVGNQMGKAAWPVLQRVASSSYLMAIIFMGTMATLFVIFNRQLPYIYIKEHDVAQLASQLILIAAFFQLADGIQVTGLGILRGMQDVKIPTFIALFSYWVVGISSSYVFGFIFDFGVHGVWYGLSTGLITTAIGTFLRYRYLLNAKKKRFPT